MQKSSREKSHIRLAPTPENVLKNIIGLTIRSCYLYNNIFYELYCIMQYLVSPSLWYWKLWYLDLTRHTSTNFIEKPVWSADPELIPTRKREQGKTETRNDQTKKFTSRCIVTWFGKDQKPKEKLQNKSRWCVNGRIVVVSRFRLLRTASCIILSVDGGRGGRAVWTTTAREPPNPS